MFLIKNRFKKLLLLAIMVSILLTPPAKAFHFGAYLGPSFFSNSPPSKGESATLLSGGFDAAFGAIPCFEIGAYYFKTFDDYRTSIGGEINFYPLFSRLWYLGAKLGNSNILSDNHITYAPVLGLNFDFAPTLSLGIEGDYFIYSSSTLKEMNLLGNIKFWF